MTNFVNGNSGDSNLIFSAFDNTTPVAVLDGNGVQVVDTNGDPVFTTGFGFSFDLGVQLSALLGADNSTSGGAASAANSVLLQANGSVEISLTGLNDFVTSHNLANVEWDVAAGDSYGRARLLVTQGDSSVSMAMNNSKVATSANDFRNYMDAVSALSGGGASVTTTANDISAYAGGATWANTAGVSGGVDNTSALTSGTVANMVMLSQTNSFGSQGATTAYTAQVTDANGTPLTAKIYQDSTGEWKLLLSSDVQAPTVTSFTPADEGTGVALDADVSVVFSEAVKLGTGNIVLKDGLGNVVETYDVTTSTNLTVTGNTLTVNPTAVLAYETGYKLEFAAGTVTDLSGNAYAGTTSYNFTTTADTAPIVVTYSPSDDATDVAIGADIVLTFSEAIVRGTGNILIKDGATVVATYDAATSTNLTVSGDTLTINPTADLGYGKAYTVEFAAGTIKDVNGNGYLGTTTYNFTTEADFDAPELTTVVGPTAAALAADLTLTFNEAVKFDTGNIVLKDADGNVVESFDVGTSTNVSISGAVLTINPTANLKPQTTYHVEFDTGAIQDLNGNSLDGNTYEGATAYNFTTLNNTVPGATAGNDKLTGTANDDLLDGLAGKDTMTGGAGNDTFVVDNAKDVVTELKDGGTADLIITKVTLPVLSKNVENLTLDGTLAAKLKGTGNELANTITGDDSHNLLNGKTGNDTVFGGLGNDTVIGDTGNDSLDGGAGNDSIDGGKGLDILFGGEGRDILLGGSENDYLDGGAQGDKLDGGTGNDTLIGNAGNDTIKGGAGSDIFQFGDDSGFDMISDFTYTAAKGKVAATEDIIQITGHKGLDNIFDANDFTVSEGFDAVLITFNDKGGQILLKGITDPAKVYFNDTNDTFTLHNDPLTNVSVGTDS